MSWVCGSLCSGSLVGGWWLCVVMLGDSILGFAAHLRIAFCTVGGCAASAIVTVVWWA